MDRAGQVEALHGAFFFNTGKQSLIVVCRTLDFDTDGMGVSEKRTLESGNAFVVVTHRNPRHRAYVEVGVQQIPQLKIGLITPVA